MGESEVTEAYERLASTALACSRIIIDIAIADDLDEGTREALKLVGTTLEDAIELPANPQTHG